LLLHEIRRSDSSNLRGRDDQNDEKPTFYDGIQLIQSHLYATTGFILLNISVRMIKNSIKEEKYD